MSTDSIFKLSQLAGVCLDKLAELKDDLSAIQIELRKRVPILNTTSSHKREVFSKVKEMPFIYKDVKLTVLDDFVMAQMASIDVQTFKQGKIYSGQELLSKFQGTRKLLFLGSAGIGKTTFQRHVILSALKKTTQKNYFNSDEDNVPFYVQLKVVNNEQPFPIIKYLLEKYTYLHGSSGLSKLIRLAEARRLFIVLDGYDEIQFPAGARGKSHLKDEMSLMMLSPLEHEPPRNLTIPPEYRRLYDSLHNNRVWLTCRDEFYEQYALQTNASAIDVNTGELRPQPLRINALKIVGIVNNRIDLINSVFRKYKKARTYRELLDAEYFLAQLDEHEDKAIQEVSYKPLFLTILCYTYATKVGREKTHEVQAANSFRDLIPECISLLLEDLDEAKTRDFNLPKRALLRRTRNEFPREKRAFLPYFATQLFQFDKKIFDVGFIKENVVTFFDLHPEYENRRKILDGLQNDSGRYPNFARQFIDCGIFVLQEKTAEGPLYDFPHYSFREVLASKYFEGQGSQFIFDFLKEKELSELLYVFFTITKSYDLVIVKLLEMVAYYPEDASYYQTVLLNCLRKAPADYDPTPTLKSFLESCITNNIGFSFTAELNPYLKKDKDLIKFLRERLTEVVDLSRIRSFTLSCDLLHQQDNKLLGELLAKRLTALIQENNFSDKFQVYCDQLSRFNKKRFDKILKDLFFTSIERDDTTSLIACVKTIVKYDAELISKYFLTLLNDQREEETSRLCRVLITLELHNRLNKMLGHSFTVYFSKADSARLSLTIRLIHEFQGDLLKAVCEQEFIIEPNSKQQDSLLALCEILILSKPDLLKELFTSTFDKIIDAEKHTSIIFYSNLINCYDRPLYNSLITAFLTKSINNETGLTLPTEVLDNFSADEEFVNYLITSYNRNIAQAKDHVIALCCELLLRYSPTDLLQLLIADISNDRGKAREAATRVILADQPVFDYVKESANLPVLIRRIISTGEIPKKAILTSEKKLSAQMSSFKYCFVITAHTVNWINRLTELGRLKVSRSVIASLTELQNTVFFSPDFLQDALPDTDLKFLKLVARVSRIELWIYQLVLTVSKNSRG